MRDISRRFSVVHTFVDDTSRAPIVTKHGLARKPLLAKRLAARHLWRRWRATLLLCLSFALCYYCATKVPIQHSTAKQQRYAYSDPGNHQRRTFTRRAVNHTLVINLARRTDRWRKIYSRLHDARLAVTLGTIKRIEAVDGSQMLSEFAHMVADGRLRQRAYELVKSSGLRRVSGRELTPGAIGCLLSHAKAWERAIALNQSILVLEDDVELLSPAFELTFYNALQELPSNFGLLYLGDMAKGTDRTIAKTPYSPNLDRLSRPLWGTFAYVVSPRAARRLVLHLYPADVQVDSYIQQVADVYRGVDSAPNFVVSTDLVFTDNSDTRDTDVQIMVTVPSSESSHPIKYHILRQEPSDGLLEFDSTYPSSPQPTVLYHDRENAVRDAWEQNMFLQSPGLSFNANDDLGWLLCIAVAMRHGGGLCFTRPLLIVRSIQHLLVDVQLGIFMAAAYSSRAAWSATTPSFATGQNTPLLTNVVYVSPSLHRAQIDAIRLAIQEAAHHFYGARDGLLANHRPETIVERVYHRLAIFSTLLPPHIFDAQLPLTRPCQCGSDDLQAAFRTMTNLYKCQSRCDRLIAPPFAAGIANDRIEINAQQADDEVRRRKQHPPTLRLHVMSRHLDRHHLLQWERLHRPPTWAVVELQPSSQASWQACDKGITSRRHALLATFCQGLAAVATHGGVYVGLERGMPSQSLVEGVLANWTAFVNMRGGGGGGGGSADGRIDAITNAPVMLWKARHGACKLALADTAAAASDRRSRLLLSPFFFAAPCPNHPVASRLASACKRLLCWASPEISEDRMMLQLGLAFADDASTVTFYSEKAVFQVESSTPPPPPSYFENNDASTCATR